MTTRSQIWDGAVWVDLTGGIDTASLDALYLRLDGGNAMTGSLDVAANDILNVRSIKGDPGDSVFFENSNLRSFFFQIDGITQFSISRFQVTVQGAGVRFSMEDVNPTGTASNAVLSFNGITSTFDLRQSTSARKYKSNIVTDPTLADLVLEPVRFHHDGDDEDYIGFVADDMPTEDAIVREKGEIENYDLRAVVAILAAKVNRLESP